MKKTEAQAQFQSGKLLQIVEYRGSRAETVNYRDKTTGKAASFVKLGHSVEAGDTPFTVDERVPDGFDSSKYQPPFKKGDKVVFHVDGFFKDKGVIKASGKLEALLD